MATVEELTDAVLDAAETDDALADAAVPTRARAAAGLLRLALDRGQAADQARPFGSRPRVGTSATAAATPLSSRRRGGRLALLAEHPALLDVAEALGRTADHLLADVEQSAEPLVPSLRAGARLQDVVTRVGGDTAARPALIDGARLIRLAAAMSRRAAVSGSQELHDRDLPQVVALRIALSGIDGTQPITPREVRDRVRARFPCVAALPERPRLDQLISDAGLDLLYDDTAQAFRAATRAGDTTGLESRMPTAAAPAAVTAGFGDHLGQRLAESTRARSFLALGVSARTPDQFDKTIDRLRSRHGAQVFDITQALVDALRAQAAAAGVPWDAVRAADAAQTGTREAQGLAALVRRTLPEVSAAIETALAAATGPLLLTDASPLARYDALSLLSRWSDLSSPRPQAIWLVVPQLMGNHGPVVDGRPVPLAAPGQFVRFDAEALTERAPT